MDKNFFYEKNHLILDSISKKLNKNIKPIFMGEWCLENFNNKLLEKKNYKIVNDERKETNKITNGISKEIIKVYNRLLNDLSILLNECHNTNYQKSYWEIIIGPFLNCFLGIVGERYRSLEFAFKKYRIKNIILANYNKNNFFLYNLTDFINRLSEKNDDLNLILNTKIFEFLNIKCNVIKIKNKKKINKKIYFSIKSKIKYFLSTISFFKKNQKYFFYETGLSSYYNFFLNLSFNQFPSIYHRIEYPQKKIDLKIRDKLKLINKKNCSDFEKLIRHLLFSFFPTDYLENYKTLKEIANNINWPKNPKIIFTSLAYYEDELFKYYLASKKENGSKYILGQHGANYFTHKNTMIETGFNSCDRFLSWGDRYSKKSINLFNLNNVSVKIKNKKRENILFFTPKMIRMMNRPWDDYGKMINDWRSTKKILDEIDDKIKDKLILKTYPKKNNSVKLEKKILDEIFLKNKNFKIFIDVDKNRIFNKSKLVIVMGDGTAFLEAITADIPVVIYMNNFNWVTEEAQTDYKRLIKAKIIFLNEKELSNHVNDVYENIDAWWNNKKVRKIKIEFEKKYAKKPPKKFIEILSNSIKRL